MLFQYPIVWRPATEVLEEDEAHEMMRVKELANHAAAKFQGTTCVYTEGVYPPSREGEVRPSPPSFELKELSEAEWKSVQRARLLAPIGTRSLLRRRFHDSDLLGKVIQDTMMVRVDNSYRWVCLHVFYTEKEGTPFPIETKKRKYMQF